MKPEKWQESGIVLLADDEEMVRTVGRRMLECLGFKVLIAADGREALEIFQQRADEIVCVLLDLTMPRMSGEEAFREIRLLRPEIKVILCSGYNEQDATRDFTDKMPAGFLQKPYTMAELQEKIREILRAAPG